MLPYDCVLYKKTGLSHIKQDFLALKQMGFWGDDRNRQLSFGPLRKNARSGIKVSGPYDDHVQ
jgi:hypothetical protein